MPSLFPLRKNTLHPRRLFLGVAIFCLISPTTAPLLPKSLGVTLIENVGLSILPSNTNSALTFAGYFLPFPFNVSMLLLSASTIVYSSSAKVRFPFGSVYLSLNSCLEYSLVNLTLHVLRFLAVTVNLSLTSNQSGENL